MASNSDNDDLTKAADHLLDLAGLQGIATATVRDGNVFVFTRAYLQALIGSLPPGQDKCVVFVKRPAPSQSN